MGIGNEAGIQAQTPWYGMNVSQSGVLSANPYEHPKHLLVNTLVSSGELNYKI